MSPKAFDYKNKMIFQDVSALPNSATGKFTLKFDHMINGASLVSILLMAKEK